MTEKGLIHFYYGYGKGKTTAAAGLALRFAAYGKRVVFVQFLKNTVSGEAIGLSASENVTFYRGTACDSFANAMGTTELELTRLVHNENLKKAVSAAKSGLCDLLVLDEVTDAYQLDLIDRAYLKEFILGKPQTLELVLTGHTPEKWLLDTADYVSEFVKIKHPFDSGVKARRGIEY